MKQDETRPFVVAAKALIVDGSGRVLLLRRAKGSSYWPEAWEFPGGKPRSNEGMDAALRREIREETSIDVELVRLVGASQCDLPHRRLLFLVIEARMADTASSIRLSSEHTEHRWVSREELPRTGLIAPLLRAVLHGAPPSSTGSAEESHHG